MILCATNAILTNMKKDDDEYSGGEIMDPAKGKTYRCKMWLEDGNLQVRGYLAFFFRTQTWYRVTEKEQLVTRPRP